MTKLIKAETLFVYLCVILLQIFTGPSSWALGPAIRYSGFSMDKVVDLTAEENQPQAQNSNQQKKRSNLPDDHYCLAIIESTPYESRKVYYTQRQFIELVRKNPFIAQHLDENLGLKVEELANYLWKNNSEKLLGKTCVGMSDLLHFLDQGKQGNLRDLLQNWPAANSAPAVDAKKAVCSLSLSPNASPAMGRNELRFLHKTVFVPKEQVQDDGFVIRTYKDPRSEFRKYWRDEHMDETAVRSLDNIEDFFKLSHMFLLNNNIVTNKQKGTRYQQISYPEQEERERKEKRSVPVTTPENAGGEGPKVIESSEEELDTEKALDELEKTVNAQEKGREKREKALAKKEAKHGVAKNFSLDDLSLRHLGKKFLLWFKTKGGEIKARQDQITGPLFPLGELENKITPEQDDFLASLQAREESFEKKMAKLELEQEKLLGNRKSKELSQDPLERYEFLDEKAQAGKASEKELKEYRDLKAYLIFGEKNFDELINAKGKKKTWKRKVYEPVKFAFQKYNWYATDTIVDLFTDNRVDASLEQLMPLSKNRAKVFRAVKGMDGAFVLSTGIAGYALAPFTFGLSVAAADALKISMSAVFSMAASAARKESWDSTVIRAGIRTGHATTEALIPFLGDVNGFYTSLDDLRVAFKVHEWFNRIRRGKKGVVKARWETLGSPLVLSFMRDRLNYLNLGLLPRAKFLYAYGNISKERKKELRSNLISLEKTRRFLIENLTVSRLRYEYLLKSGKIPNFMLKDVVVNLEQEERSRKLFSSTQFQEKALWQKMREAAIADTKAATPEVKKEAVSLAL